MALRAMLVVAFGVVLAFALCGCGASAPPVAPNDASNKPAALAPNAPNQPGPHKGAFFTNPPPASGGGKTAASAGTAPR